MPSDVVARLRDAARAGTLFHNKRWVPHETDALTLAGGRRWLSFWHGALALELDRALVRYVGWSPVYVLFAHRGPGPLPGVPVLLHTLGRVSGQVRTVVVPAFRLNGSWVVCATAAGGPRDPQWVRNIAVNPHISLHLRRKRRDATARILAGSEREAAEAVLKELHIGLGIYQQRAARFGRTIPLVGLDIR